MPVIGFQISPEQLAELDRAAKSAGNTRSGILRLALDQLLEPESKPSIPDAVAYAKAITAKPVPRLAVEPVQPPRQVKSFFKKTETR